jgi:hypothetical protein
MDVGRSIRQEIVGRESRVRIPLFPLSNRREGIKNDSQISPGDVQMSVRQFSIPALLHQLIRSRVRMGDIDMSFDIENCPTGDLFQTENGSFILLHDNRNPSDDPQNRVIYDGGDAIEFYADDIQWITFGSNDYPLIQHGI